MRKKDAFDIFFIRQLDKTTSFPKNWHRKSEGYSVLALSTKYELNEPNWYIPVLFVYRQQIVCHTDHASGSNLDLQRL